MIATAIAHRLPDLVPRAGELFMALETGASVEELIGARTVCEWMGADVAEEDDE